METDSCEDDRTVVVSGVVDVLPVSRMIDKLTIHFQSCRRSHGGDVEVVRYPTNMDGVAFVTFDQAKAEQYKLLADAERVVRKEQQIMVDDEFPEEYLLTVFPFTRDVYLYVPSATIDLSIFGSKQALLIQSLRAAHRSLRFQPFLHDRKATIEGPFTAVQALREDLIRRASQLKSTVSAQTAAVKLRESPLNPRAISHHESVSSVSCSGSKANQEPVRSNGLSTPLQTTGEATEVQSLLSYAKTQMSATRQKVSYESLDARSLCDTESNEEEKLGAQSSFKMPKPSCVITLEETGSSQSTTEYRTNQATKTNPRQVFREPEINAEIRSSLSRLVRLPAEEISAKQPGVDGISQKHTTLDRISATKTRGENHLGSGYSSTDYLMESDQSSSAVTAKLLQTIMKDVSMSSETNAEDTRELSIVRPEDLKDKCIWVDSDTFRYIKKLERKELNRCLRGLDASVECVEGTDLTQILLTGKQNSKTASRVQHGLEELETLAEFWQSSLRVHWIHFDEDEQPEKEKLIQICNDVNFLFDDVLYMIEDCSIKVIGPSVSSYLFYRRVKDRITKLTNTFL
ncbi:uncharacterized protein LOC121892346 isoform X1 [Thunnus maccoyii]|uniref:uncharacterized protein LOC121892346 isoform X1 n=1 Tax=Thunnus maccoyii TaxID=8240 RepID=UPI001C4BD988|nr:uncharacterized protein LOC121892346 isoform X1 [Thunnus maccoyii]